VVLVAALWVWSAFGGVAHTATDHTVSAARSKATPIAQADVERIVTVLAPNLGQPALRAVVEGIHRALAVGGLGSRCPRGVHGLVLLRLTVPVTPA